ncbi:MAG TPA: hypothetical protein VER55_09950, partial [Ardenticatenaceae bacterium]|nr:hypothetical protein [Ardenticatenaceae bacterium]
MEATTLIRGRGTHVWRRCTVLCVLVVLCGLVVACNRQGPAVATESPQPAPTLAPTPAVNAEWGRDVAFAVRAGGREELLEGTPVALNVGDGVGVEKDGRVLLRFADLLTVEVLRAGELTVRELAIDEQAIFITVLQIAGTFVNDFHPQEAVRRRLSVESDFATITATGTRFLVVREANSPLEWVVALDAPAGDLEVTGEDGGAQPLTSGMARWVAPIGEPGEAIAADMQQVDAWLEGVRRGAPQPEIGEVVWPPADVVASTEPVPELPQPGTPFELEGVTLVLDPAGLFGAPEYALEDCNGDGIRDVAIQRGKVWMDFRPVLRRVRALDVTILNRGQPRSGALRVLDPAQVEIVRQQVEVDAGQTQVLSLRSGEPYHYAELLMTDGCFLGFSLTPPRDDGTPGEARAAVPSISPSPTPSSEPT